MLRNLKIMILHLAVCITACCGAVPGAADDIETNRPRTDPISQAALIPWRGDFALPSDLGLPFDEVRFQNASGHRLRGWLIGSSEARQTILFCMGNTGNISVMLPYARILHDAGYEVLLFDYQGFGNSEGIASVTSLIDDCSAACNFLINSRGRKPSQIGVFGVSLGSVLALTLATEKSLGPVAVEDAWIPQEEVDKLAKQRFKQDNVLIRMSIASLKAMLLSRIDPLANVRKLKSPLFMIHGVNDRLLPPMGTIKIAEQCVGPLRIYLVPNAGHAPETLEVHEREYSFQLARFFQDGFAGNVVTDRVAVQKNPTNVDSPRKVEIQSTTELDQKECWQFCCQSGKTLHFGFSKTTSWSPAPEFKDVDRVFALRVGCMTESERGFQPDLTNYSAALDQYRQTSHAILGSEFWAENLIGFQGRGFYLYRSFGARPKLNQKAVRKLFTDLPSVKQLPDRIGPRYAKLLARLHCWDQKPGDVRSSPAALAMLRYLPANVADYYELGNARIQLGFRDSVVADVLYQMARLRLREGQVSEARRLMSQHVKVLPKSVKTDWTAERIQAIQHESDLMK